jgi:tetratricopeptide (TPR) repeat protein
MKKLRLYTTTTLVLVLLTATAHAGWEEGRAAFQKGDLNQAANEFKAVVDGQPDWPGGHFMLGWTYLRMNRNQDAITHLRKAYDLDKNNAAYQLRLGEAYVKAGRYSDAVGFLSKINPSSLPKDMQGFLAQLKAVAKSKSGQSALGELAAAIKIDPNNADLQYQYGAAALNEGQTDTAIRALETAVRLDPGDADKQRAVANVYLRKGRTTRGAGKVGYYQKAVGAAQKVVAKSVQRASFVPPRVF